MRRLYGKVAAIKRGTGGRDGMIMQDVDRRAAGRRIRGVADTALWMAAIRAAETKRRDALMEDRWAARLAGNRGRAIERSMPRRAETAWGVVMRTTAIDRLLEAALRGAIDTVVNLGAGYDMRPYRLEVPSALRWIEIDLADVMVPKSEALQACEPNCSVVRMTVNLSSRPERRCALAAAVRDSKHVLLITEGLIPYFTADRMAEFAEDVGAIAAFDHWIQDFDDAGLRRPMPRAWEAALDAAPLRFQVADWFAFFRAAGWSASRLITTFDESARTSRPYPFSLPGGLLMRVLPAAMRQKVLSTTGAVLLERTATAA